MTTQEDFAKLKESYEADKKFYKLVSGVETKLQFHIDKENGLTEVEQVSVYEGQEKPSKRHYYLVSALDGSIDAIKTFSVPRKTSVELLFPLLEKGFTKLAIKREGTGPETRYFVKPL
jgi:hypothetical protein